MSPPDRYQSDAADTIITIWFLDADLVEPRAVMREFGLELDESVQIRVVDSAANSFMTCATWCYRADPPPPKT